MATSAFKSRCKVWQAPKPAAIVADDKALLTFEVPVEQPNAPGIKARLRIETRFWNNEPA